MQNRRRGRIPFFRAIILGGVSLLLTSCSSEMADQLKAHLNTGTESVLHLLVADSNLTEGETEFRNYVRQYENPQLFLDNNVAFDARLHLLDHAPRGSTVKIMSFLYDFGPVALKLASHMCSAVERGVTVLFTPDNNSGGLVDKVDFFDRPNAEEALQFLANCGVQVRIHNYMSENDFEIRTATLRNLYYEVKKRDKAWYSKLGIDIKAGFRRFVLSNVVSGVIPTGELGDKVWEEWTKERDLKIPYDLRELLENVVETNDKSEALLAIRNAKEDRTLYHLPFNRINHRKLFWVQSAAGDTCFFLGGRNLGDHYLHWETRHESFVDGDVMICDHHVSKDKGDENVIAEASDSFDENFYALNDGLPREGRADRPLNKEVEPNLDYEFKYIRPEAQVPGFKISPEAIDSSDPMAGVIPTTRPINARESIIHGDALAHASRWRVRTSGWRWEQDHVREELLDIIGRETVEINIESPYVTLDEELKIALHKALLNGVRVNLISNGMFTADGVSGVIRFMNGRWVRQMADLFPENFRFYSTALEGGGHMIHFKGVGARCQYSSERNEYYKTFLIGSHNFHLRSGTSDKEHALVWDEPAGAECVKGNPKAREVLPVKEIQARYVDFDAGIPKPEWADMIDLKKQQWRELNCFLVGTDAEGRDKTTGQAGTIYALPLNGAVANCLKTDPITVRMPGGLLKRYTSLATEIQDTKEFFKDDYKSAAGKKYYLAEGIMNKLMVPETDKDGNVNYKLLSEAEVLLDYGGPLWDILMPFL